jgi:hypothetical protein
MKVPTGLVLSETISDLEFLGRAGLRNFSNGRTKKKKILIFLIYKEIQAKGLLLSEIFAHFLTY